MFQVSQIMLLLLAFLLPLQPAFATDKVIYKDIYLTQNRVCRSCTWEWQAKDRKILLINRSGQATLVKPKEILGMDTHPIVRRLMLKSLHGVGKAGIDIVPGAFDEANDVFCKYCD